MGEGDAEPLADANPIGVHLVPIDWEAAELREQTGLAVATLRDCLTVTFAMPGIYYAECELDGVEGPKLPFAVHVQRGPSD